MNKIIMAVVLLFFYGIAFGASRQGASIDLGDHDAVTVGTGYPCNLYSTDPALVKFTGGDPITSGLLTVGDTYKINTRTDADFTTVGAADNNPGTVFAATGTGSGLLDAGDTVLLLYPSSISDLGGVVISAERENLGGELSSGTTDSGLSYEITSHTDTDFTIYGATDNNVGTQFVATGAAPLDAGDKVKQIVPTEGQSATLDGLSEDEGYLYGLSLVDETVYGTIWNASTDTYQTGTVSSGVFTSSTLSSFPVHESVRWCTLNDDGSVNYYLESTDRYNRNGVSPSVTGTDDAGTANKISDTGVFTESESAYIGKYVHNTTDNTYSMITAKDSDNALSIMDDIVDIGETFEICTARLDGGDGQVMTQFKKFYQVRYQYGNLRYFFISLSEFYITIGGTRIYAEKAPMFHTSDYAYVGTFEGAMYDDSAGAIASTVHTSIYASGDKLCSVAGHYPKTSETIIDFRSMAEQRGNGWHQYDVNSHDLLGMLYITEFGNFNAQSEIGMGRTTLSGGVWEAGSYIGRAGLSLGLSGWVGNVSNGGGNYDTDYCFYFFENPWGNVWKFQDGVNIHNSSANGSQLYISNNPDYESDTSTNYTLSGQLAESDGYVTDLVDSLGFFPSAVGGGEDSYVCDYYYTHYDNDNDSGWLVARVGGFALHGANAGPFYVNSYYDSSNAYSTIGGRLCYSADSSGQDDYIPAYVHLATPDNLTIDPGIRMGLNQDSPIRLSTGNLVVDNQYFVCATQTDHFFSGCKRGDVFKATATTSLDANNVVILLDVDNPVSIVVSGQQSEDVTADTGIACTHGQIVNIQADLTRITGTATPWAGGVAGSDYTSTGSIDDDIICSDDGTIKIIFSSTFEGAIDDWLAWTMYRVSPAAFHIIFDD